MILHSLHCILPKLPSNKQLILSFSLLALFSPVTYRRPSSTALTTDHHALVPDGSGRPTFAVGRHQSSFGRELRKENGRRVASFVGHVTIATASWRTRRHRRHFLGPAVNFFFGSSFICKMQETKPDLEFGLNLYLF